MELLQTQFQFFFCLTESWDKFLKLWQYSWQDLISKKKTSLIIFRTSQLEFDIKMENNWLTNFLVDLRWRICYCSVTHICVFSFLKSDNLKLWFYSNSNFPRWTISISWRDINKNKFVKCFGPQASTIVKIPSTEFNQHLPWNLNFTLLSLLFNVIFYCFPFISRD